jgi:hypothetical protein
LVQGQPKLGQQILVQGQEQQLVQEQPMMGQQILEQAKDWREQPTLVQQLQVQG